MTGVALAPGCSGCTCGDGVLTVVGVRVAVVSRIMKVGLALGLVVTSEASVAGMVVGRCVASTTGSVTSSV